MKFYCPHCGATLEAADEHRGLKADCAYCSGKFTVPITAGLTGLNPGELLARGLNTVEPPSVGGWDPPTPEELQRLLPQFQIESIIGRGGMGAVYKGSQARLGRHVAIKLLPAELAEDENFVTRFEREARTLARLDHPGIIHVHDFGQTSENHLYFVMEFVDGTDLHQMIHGPGLDPAQALEIIVQVCDALQFAHSKGVIHRDIKPANILVTRDARVKLCDFGLARPLQSGLSGQLTLTRVIMGTPEYMAPEQKRGEGDHRVDLYALGVMLYEMLCGRTPQGAWQAPSQRVQVDVRLDQVVIKAMQEEPERRYQHASEVKTDVDAIRTSVAAGRNAPKKATPSPKPGKKDPLPQAPGSSVVAKRSASSSSPPKTALIAAAVLLPLVAVGAWLGLNGNDSPAGKSAGPEAANVMTDSGLPAVGLDVTRKMDEPIARLKKALDTAGAGNLRLGNDAIRMSTPGRLKLNLKGAKITNLDALRGFPVAQLELSESEVTNIEALRGTSIERAFLGLQGKVTDISPLADCPELEMIELSPGVKDVEPLRKLHRLKYLSYRFDISNFRPAQTAAEFWKEYDAKNPSKAGTASTPPAAPLDHAAALKLFNEATAEWQKLPEWKAARNGDRIVRMPDGTYDLFLDKLPISDLSPLAKLVGITLNGISLSDTGVSDLGPLKGSGLRGITLTNSLVTDLSPLRGLPIVGLYAQNNPFATLAGLEGMPLQKLDVRGGRVNTLEALRGGNTLKSVYFHHPGNIGDLTPLSGHPLKYLCVHGARSTSLKGLEGSPLEKLDADNMRSLRDISALRGLPLVSVNFNRSAGIEDYTPLLDCPSLRKVQVHVYPEAAGVLRPMKLESINGKPAAEYWAMWDETRKMDETIARLRKALAAAGAGNLAKTEILVSTPGHLYVDLTETQVTNLEALRGFPVTHAILHQCEVTNLEALRGMPIVRVHLGEKSKVTDIRPLADCPELEMILLAPGVKDVEPLRKLPKLKYLSYNWDSPNTRPAQSAEAFWKEYDAKRKLDEPIARLKKALDAAGAGTLKAGENAISMHAPGRLKMTLNGAKITDLEALRGFPVAHLELAGSDVTKLEALRGSSIERIYLNSGGKITDIRPLAECPELETILLSPDVKDVEPLRKLPKLKYLSYRFDAANFRPAQTAAEFWKEHDAKNR